MGNKGAAKTDSFKICEPTTRRRGERLRVSGTTRKKMIKRPTMKGCVCYSLVNSTEDGGGYAGLTSKGMFSTKGFFRVATLALRKDLKLEGRESSGVNYTR